MEAASASGLSMVRQNFSTRIEGTPGEVFGWLAGAFDRARGEAAHVIVTAVMGPSLGKSQTFTLAS